jgi:hypothetical protein
MSSYSEHQFISHVVEDKGAVARLEADLRRLGFSPWVSHSQLPTRGGRRWQDLIREAIRSGVAFIACFSSVAAERATSYMREELVIARQELRLRPRDQAWFFPVRLDDCEVPDDPIGAGETLRDIQHIDLLPEVWEVGLHQLAASLARPDDRTEKWLRQMVQRFADEPPRDRERWLHVLRSAAVAGLATVSVADPTHDVALRLSHQGALLDDWFVGAWHKFRLTERGRLLLAELLARYSDAG